MNYFNYSRFLVLTLGLIVLTSSALAASDEPILLSFFERFLPDNKAGETFFETLNGLPTAGVPTTPVRKNVEAQSSSLYRGESSVLSTPAPSRTSAPVTAPPPVYLGSQVSTGTPAPPPSIAPSPPPAQSSSGSMHQGEDDDFFSDQNFNYDLPDDTFDDGLLDDF